MPDILGPTNHVPTYDNTNNANIRNAAANVNVNNNNIKNVVDPTKVVRTDSRTEQQNLGDATQSNALRYESNFMTFVQRLRNSPDLSSTVMQYLQGRGIEVSSGITEGISQEIAALLDFFKMDESQLANFLQTQLQSEAKFGGALFQALRNAYSTTQSGAARNEILLFLQHFSDYASTSHLENKISNTLDELEQSMPSKWSTPLSEMTGQVKNAIAAGDRQSALNILRQQVFPLVSKYVSTTHDHGRARQLLSMMTLDLVRYDNGEEQAMLQSLRKLTGLNVLPKELNDLEDADLMRMINDSEYFKASQKDVFSDYLSSVTKKAMSGEGGVQTQEAFQNIMESVLLNQSVFMPLKHIIIPLDWNGKTMFSEMWIDPDTENKKNTPAAIGEKNCRVLIKMDVENIGAFDLLINMKGQTASVDAACPESVASFSQTITGAISGILRNNGLEPGTVSVSAMKKPKTISQVFPNVFRNTEGVDVKI